MIENSNAIIQYRDLNNCISRKFQHHNTRQFEKAGHFNKNNTLIRPLWQTTHNNL